MLTLKFLRNGYQLLENMILRQDIVLNTMMILESMKKVHLMINTTCLLYTSDAADEL